MKEDREERKTTKHRERDTTKKGWKPLESQDDSYATFLQHLLQKFDADVQFRSVEVRVVVPNGPLSDFISVKEPSDKSTVVGQRRAVYTCTESPNTSVDYTTATTKHIHDMFECFSESSPTGCVCGPA